MNWKGVECGSWSSTAATYGMHTEMPLTEESPQTPETPYGSTKLAGEWMIRASPTGAIPSVPALFAR